MSRLDLGSLLAPNVRQRAAEGVSGDDPATVCLPARSGPPAAASPDLGRVWSGDLPEGKTIHMGWKKTPGGSSTRC